MIQPSLVHSQRCQEGKEGCGILMLGLPYGLLETHPGEATDIKKKKKMNCFVNAAIKNQSIMASSW